MTSSVNKTYVYIFWCVPFWRPTFWWVGHDRIGYCQPQPL